MAYFFFTDKILKGDTVKIFTDDEGNSLGRDFTYIDDVVQVPSRSHCFSHTVPDQHSVIGRKLLAKPELNFSRLSATSRALSRPLTTYQSARILSVGLHGSKQTSSGCTTWATRILCR
eukprot:scaffold2773_cov410-Prasinococcus_capsulatus_cf.AAC.23